MRMNTAITMDQAILPISAWSKIGIIPARM